MLVVVPSKRISAQEALRHPYFENMENLKSKDMYYFKKFEYEKSGKGILEM